MRKIIFLFPVLLAVAVLAVAGTGCSAKARTAYHLQKANQYFAAGQYDQAEVEYMNVLRSDRENFQAISRLADIYFDEGRMQRAAPFVFAGHKLATNDLDLNAKLGVIYLASGKVKEARVEAGFVLDRNPQSDQAAQLLLQTATTPQTTAESKTHLQLLSQKNDSAALQVALGSIALRAGDYKSAESAFKRAQTLDPKSSTAWSALGILYLAQTNLAQAGSALKTAADLAPARSNAKVQYAQFKAQTGDPTAAKQMLETMVQNTPDYIPAWMALSGIAASEKKYDDCTDILNKVLARAPENFNAQLALAQIKLVQGKAAEATADLERMANTYAKVPQVHYQLALAYLAGNETNAAAISLKRALALDPNFSDATLLQAGLQIQNGAVGPAIVSLQQLTRQYPQIVLAQLLLADAYRVQGNFEETLKIYRQLEESYPKSYEFPLAVGKLYFQQKNNDAARQAFTQAFELAPDNLTVVENLVDLDLSEKQYATALQQVQPQLDKNPKQAAPLVLQGRIFMAQGDVKQAEAALIKAIALQPDAEPIYMLLAGLYKDTGQNQKALAQLQIAATKNPNDVMPLMLTGMIYNDEKDYKAARDAYEKLLVMDPQYGPALNNLAYLYSEYLGDLDRAYELAQKARDVLPGDPSTADTLGWILSKRGQYASAAGLLQECARQLPNEPEIQFHLGKTYYQMHQEEAARLALQRALQSGRDFLGKDECAQCLAILSVNVKTAGPDARASLERRVAVQPDDSIALMRLAAIYQRDGAVDKAENLYETALKADPKNVNALVNLAQLYYADKNTSKALELAKSAYNLAPENADVALIRARLAYATGDYKLALVLLRPIAGNQFNSPQVWFDLARAAYAMGQVTDAQTALRNSLQSGSDFVGANEARRLLDLTTLAANSPQAVSAASQVATILKSQPDYVPALMVQAGINEQKNDFAGAKQAYLKVLGQYPDFSPAQKRLAILCAENADSDSQAYQYATAARNAFPDDPEVAKAYGILIYLHGDYKRAERVLKESAIASPTDPEILYYLGMAQYQQKERSESKQNLQQALHLNLPAKFDQETKRVLAELK